MRANLIVAISLLCSVVLTLLPGRMHQAKADIITGVQSVSGPGGFGMGPMMVVTPNRDMEDGVGNPNVIVIQETFTSFNPIDIVFNVAETQGTTEYRITKIITNATGTTIPGYVFALGFRGFGTANPNFVLSGAGDGLDFDTPNPDPIVQTPVFFTRLNGGPFVGGVIQEDVNVFEGPPGQPHMMTWTVIFSIDVPAGIRNLHPDGLTQFTLRQIPLPEPSAFTLLGLGTIGLLGYGWRRRKSVNCEPSAVGYPSRSVVDITDAPNVKGGR